MPSTTAKQEKSNVPLTIHDPRRPIVEGEEMKLPHGYKVGDKGKTRGGAPYEILLVDARLGVFPVRALVEGELYACTADGRYFDRLEPYVNDLLPPSRTVYVNFYADGDAKWHESAAAAEEWAINPGLIALAVPVEIPG